MFLKYKVRNIKYTTKVDQQPTYYNKKNLLYSANKNLDTAYKKYLHRA